jgi:hypothetical protein
VIDALQYTWTGKWPAERSPVINTITINNRRSTDNIYLQPGSPFTAGITTGSSDTTGMYVTCQLQRDELEVAELYSKANYKQEKNYNYLSDSLALPVSYETVNQKGIASRRINIHLQAPADPGPYRLFIYLHNRNNRVATANACFYVHD